MPSIVGDWEQADWFSLCTTSRMLSIVGETIRCLSGMIVFAKPHPLRGCGFTTHSKPIQIGEVDIDEPIILLDEQLPPLLY